MLSLEASDLLQREQLKTVFGGYVSTGCAYQGGNGYAGISSPTMSYSEAQSGASITGGYFCCASCCSVGWLDQDHKNYLGC